MMLEVRCGTSDVRWFLPCRYTNALLLLKNGQVRNAVLARLCMVYGSQ